MVPSSVFQVIAGWPVVAFSGSRHSLPSSQGWVAAYSIAAGLPSSRVAVGCARGIDAAVRQAAPGCQVFQAAGSQGWQLAARSSALVRAASGGGLVAFPSGFCPAGVRVSRSFSGSGSGTWGSVAFAIGQGVPVIMFASVAPGSVQAWLGPLASYFQVLHSTPSCVWLAFSPAAQPSLF